ncbi:hypothetical protein NNJEOMEG_02151 [Fundidesulfovibrio magnetotacticus]|uniref:Uncharacterized protein n=1 Tax=Fundidesulfovibrio magnetotacticus TaxID=2730080 RepID=A0A6V8LW73_9BACT|nr:hypothetical protein [Fundidesulfovibrio magnetotacticus]GFK94309.1 hypothetical protein NNJEOMEG_02151 [Fundidesulfovibrio magnetotacticus]
MLQFNALVQLPNETSNHQVLMVCNEWIAGSPHSKLKRELEEHKHEEHGYSITTPQEEFTSERIIADEYDLVGVKYCTFDDDGNIWRSEIVSNKRNTAHNISIRVYSESHSPQFQKPDAKKPYLIKMLLENLDRQLIMAGSASHNLGF